MKSLHKFQNQNFRGVFVWGLFTLVFVLLASVWGCGKLSDDTNQPSTPIGTSGGVPVNGGPKDTQGTYHLNLTANQKSIPANLTAFSVLSATLSDESGRSVQGYNVKFYSDAHIGWFYEPVSGKFINEDEAFTDKDGTAQTRFYGSQSGETTVTAAIDLNSDGVFDITSTVVVTLTSSGPPNEAGNYSIEVGVDRKSVPADMATYAIVYATVRDRSGGPVQGMTITFTSELGYVHNDPTPPSVPSTVATAVTNSKGSASIYYYGDRAGSGVITASVSPSDLTGTLTDTTKIIVTEGPGEPGNNVPGLFIKVTNGTQQLEGDSKTGAAESKDVIIEVDVWDATGDKVGPGVQVEFTGDVRGYANTDSTGRATLRVDPKILSIGNYSYNFTACVYSILPDQKQRCSDGGFSISVLPPDLDVEMTVIPSSVELTKSGKVLVTVTYLNSPVANAKVSYFSGGLVTPSSGIVSTNASGIAQFSFTGSQEGTDTIVAVVETTIEGAPLRGGAQGTVSVTVPTANP